MTACATGKNHEDKALQAVMNGQPNAAGRFESAVQKPARMSEYRVVRIIGRGSEKARAHGLRDRLQAACGRLWQRGGGYH